MSVSVTPLMDSNSWGQSPSEESGDFMKTSLDMEHHEILLTRSCCIPEPERGNVRKGFLRIKPKMMR